MKRKLNIYLKLDNKLNKKRHIIFIYNNLLKITNPQEIKVIKYLKGRFNYYDRPIRIGIVNMRMIWFFLLENTSN